MTPEERVLVLQRKVVERPDDPFVRYGLAMSYRLLGRAAEALDAFEELARRSPDYVPTYLMLGQVLAGLGRADEAARVYEAGASAAARQNDSHAHGELLRAIEDLRSPPGG